MATHEVTNQVPDFVGHDLFATDPVLVDAIQRWGDARDADDLGGLGRLANAEPTQAHADRADLRSVAVLDAGMRFEAIRLTGAMRAGDYVNISAILHGGELRHRLV